MSQAVVVWFPLSSGAGVPFGVAHGGEGVRG
jgi:hypothetical protein